MTSISHALIGASIAARLGNPYAIAGVALVTHFLCDMIPHWDLGTNWRMRPKAVTGTLAILETLMALSLFFFLSPFVPSHFNLAVGIFFSLLPDWTEVPYYLLLPNPPKAFYYIYKFQSILHSKAQYPWGVITQVVTVGAFLVVGFII